MFATVPPLRRSTITIRSPASGHRDHENEPVARRGHAPHLRARRQPEVARRGKRRRFGQGAQVRLVRRRRVLVPGELGQLVALLDELEADHDEAAAIITRER